MLVINHFTLLPGRALMKYLIKRSNKYLNSYKENNAGEIYDFFFHNIEYAWGFDSIESAQEWADLSGGTVVLPIKAYSQQV